MRRLPAAALLSAVLALLTFVLYLLFPLTGDDYGYMGTFRTIDGFDGAWPLERLWRWYPFHWLHANGRLANLLALLSLTFLPKWAVAAVMGVATWGMMALLLRLGDAWRGRVGAAAAALAYVAVAFPWWDLMYTPDFNFNYPVATCAGLLFVYMWQRYRRIEKGWRRACCLAAAFVAGGFHESMGAPLLAAGVWLLVCGRKLPRKPLAAFGAGVALAFCSPGIWGRAAAGRVADAPLPELLLCSAPLTLAAALFFAGHLFSRSGRERLLRESRGWTGFWMAASLGSLLFCAAGGIIGRSGWFSQSFALVALLLWWRRGAKSRSGVAEKVFAVAAGVAALFFTAAPIPFVAEMAAREGEARELLRRSDDGVVAAAMPKESGMPWWTLGRVRCLDADDYYLHQVIADYYKKPRFVIVPPDGAEMAAELPPGAEPIEAGSFGAPDAERFLHTAPDGVQRVYVWIPAERGYAVFTRERDPGDR